MCSGYPLTTPDRRLVTVAQMIRFRRWVRQQFVARGTAQFLTASLALGVLVGLGAAVLVWAIGGALRIWVSADDAQAVRAMTTEDAEHAHALTDMILQLNGSPSPLPVCFVE